MDRPGGVTLWGAHMTSDRVIPLLGLYSKEFLAQTHRAIYYSVEVT